MYSYMQSYKYVVEYIFGLLYLCKILYVYLTGNKIKKYNDDDFFETVSYAQAF